MDYTNEKNKNTRHTRNKPTNYDKDIHIRIHEDYVKKIKDEAASRGITSALITRLIIEKYFSDFSLSNYIDEEVKKYVNKNKNIKKMSKKQIENKIFDYFISKIKNGIEYYVNDKKIHSFESIFIAFKTKEVIDDFITKSYKEFPPEQYEVDYIGQYLKAVNKVKREYQGEIELEKIKRKNKQQKSKNMLFYTGTLLAIDKWLNKQ